MDKNPKRSTNPLQNFTDAVKTIVNVPKEAIDKPTPLKPRHNELTCPICGEAIDRKDDHKDKH